MASWSNNLIQIWYEGNPVPSISIPNNLVNPFSLFISNTGDIYIGNSYPIPRVDKWRFGATTSSSVMFVSEPCLGLFVDINDTLYCSIMNLHKVVSKSLSSNTNLSTVVAGTGCPGDTPYMLYYPNGIFVHINLDLYVADCGNNRIQRFRSGELNGITVAGNGVSGTFILKCPTSVILDADGNLFIVDRSNHRIIGSSPKGFRCVVGCSGSWSSPSYNQLSYPQSMAFDRHGNLFVTDTQNSRIQKFMLLNNSLSKLKIDFFLLKYLMTYQLKHLKSLLCS